MVGKLDDTRNVIPMLKTIELAFNQQRLCFILDDPEGHDAKVKIRIFDPSLRDEIVEGTITFRALEGRPFDLSKGGPDGQGPFMRCLSFHAQCAFNAARKRGWVSSSDSRPIQYGSPLDTDTISFVAERC